MKPIPPEFEHMPETWKAIELIATEQPRMTVGELLAFLELREHGANILADLENKEAT